MNNLNVPGIEVELKEPFSIIRESLDRIGYADKDEKILNPDCYLLHKQGKYFIIHYKNLLKMDGNLNTFTEDDAIREISVAKLLEQWNLINIIETKEYPDELTFVYVLPYKMKKDWKIIHKYKIGEIS